MHPRMPGTPLPPCNALQQQVPGAREQGSRLHLRHADGPVCTMIGLYRQMRRRRGLLVSMDIVTGQQMRIHRLTESPWEAFWLRVWDG